MRLCKGVICTNSDVRFRGMGYETMSSAKRKKVNVLKMKCLRSLARVTRMDRSEKVRRRGPRKGAGESSGSESIEMVWTCGENG